MRTILEVLNLSTDYLQKKGMQSAKRQAEELIGEALKVGRMGLYMQFDRPLTDSELDLCRGWLKRRGEGEPLQYISGQVEFFDCQIKVTPAVLIPRQETEILVDKIVKKLAACSLADKELWDVCCGSGCIGIALKKRFPELRVVLSDLSPAALEIAKENARQNQVEVEFLQGDLLAPFSGRHVDFVVSNPPYVTDKEFLSLETEVRVHEPRLALVSGESGVEFYQRLANDLPAFLKSQGKAWFEIGDGQGKAVQQIFLAVGFQGCAVECDWSGRERFFSLENE